MTASNKVSNYRPARMNTWRRAFVRWTRPPRGRAARDIVALFALLQAAVRIPPLEGRLQAVNLLPSWLYGLLMLVCAVGLLATGDRCRRVRWPGRLVAALAAGLWLLLALDIWGAWLSCGAAVILACVAFNEVRVDEC